MRGYASFAQHMHIRNWKRWPAWRFRATLAAKHSKPKPNYGIDRRRDTGISLRHPNRRHIHRNIHPMPLAADQDSPCRADIVVIPAPGERDVSIGRHQAIRGIEIHPAGAGRKRADPGVRGVRSDYALVTGRRVRGNVPTDITGGKSERTQAANL